MFRLVEREKAKYRVTHMCRVLGVSLNVYCMWLRFGPSQRVQRDAELLERIYSRSKPQYLRR